MSILFRSEKQIIAATTGAAIKISLGDYKRLTNATCSEAFPHEPLVGWRQAVAEQASKLMMDMVANSPREKQSELFGGIATASP